MQAGTASCGALTTSVSQANSGPLSASNACWQQRLQRRYPRCLQWRVPLHPAEPFQARADARRAVACGAMWWSVASANLCTPTPPAL